MERISLYDLEFKQMSYCNKCMSKQKCGLKKELIMIIWNDAMEDGNPVGFDLYCEGFEWRYSARNNG